MLAAYDLRTTSEKFSEILPRLVARVAARPASVLAAVREILTEVDEGGDAALCACTARFDGVELAPSQLWLTPAEAEAAWDTADPDFRDALTRAASRIRAYHTAFRHTEGFREELDGLIVEERILPVDRAGIYVPGGRADYPSTVLMTVIPAQVAGVGELVVCVPPDKDGLVPRSTAAALHLLGVSEVYKIGGAQAIAALAYGTETIRPVDKIVGPGNVYVALAKAEVAHRVGVESIAGPSELLIIADELAPPDQVAIDLMAQAEHGPGGFIMLVTWSDELADAVRHELKRLVSLSPRRREIEDTFVDGGRLVLCAGATEALDIANAAAPEHLQLMVTTPTALLPKVRHAGAVFCGYDTPVTLGDYVAGPSHVLPTAGTARFASALHVADFQKSLHIVTASRKGLAEIAPVACKIAETEGLQAHADAITVRLGGQGLGAGENAEKTGF